MTSVLPEQAFCFMSASAKSGADLYDAGSIRCSNGCLITISGVATTSPAYTATMSHAPDTRPVTTGKIQTGKLIDNKIYGSEGMLLYCGDDADPSSGCLSVSRLDGTRNQAYPELGGFLFENTAHAEAGGKPESLQSLLDACNGMPYWSGTSSELGLLVVRTVDALYRSAKSGKAEDV